MRSFCIGHTSRQRVLKRIRSSEPSSIVLRGTFTQEPSRLDQIKTYLHETKSNVKYVDVRPALLKHKDVQLYSKNDTHWNHYGAFIAYQDLMKAITTDFPTAGSIRTLDEYDVQWKPSASGDLLNILGMAGAPVFTEQAPSLTPKDKVHFAVKEIPTENYPVGKSMLHRNDSCTNKLRVLVFRDSYTGAVIPFFSTNFYEVLYIWHVYDPAIVDQFKPDIVVESFVSRFAFY